MPFIPLWKTNVTPSQTVSDKPLKNHGAIGAGHPNCKGGTVPLPSTKLNFPLQLAEQPGPWYTRGFKPDNSMQLEAQLLQR